MALTLSPNESNALVYTLILKENGDTIVHAGKKTFINLPPEKFNNITSFQRVFIEDPATVDNLKKLVGKDITTLNLRGGVELNADNITASVQIRALLNSIRATQVNYTGTYPAMTPAISAEMLTIKGDARALLAINNGTKVVDLTEAQLPDTLYINDDCESVWVRAEDLAAKRVILPFDIKELHIKGDISKISLDLSQLPHLKKIETIEDKAPAKKSKTKREEPGSVRAAKALRTGKTRDDR